MIRGFAGWMRDLMDQNPMKDLAGRLDPSTLWVGAQGAWQQVREEVQRTVQERRLPDWADLAQRLADSIRRTPLPLPLPTVNALGWIFHPRLSGPPWAEEAVRIAAQTASGTVSADWAAAGAPSFAAQSHELVKSSEELLRRLTGTEAALLLPSTAVAVTALADGIASGGAILLPRRDNTPLTGAEDVPLPEALRLTNVGLIEAGSAQGFRREDLAAVHTPQVRLVLRRRPQAYRIVGEAWEMPDDELARWAAEHGALLAVDLGQACLADPVPLGLPTERAVKATVDRGVPLILFRTDGLVGGPAAAAIVGTKEAVARIRNSAWARLTTLGHADRAALWATLELYRDPAVACERVPVLQLLSTQPDNLRHRAERLTAQFAACPGVSSAEAKPGRTALTPYGLPGEELPTWRVHVRLGPPSETAEAGPLAERFLAGPPAVLCLARGNELVFDLRGVQAGQDALLVDCLAAVRATPTG